MTGTGRAVDEWLALADVRQQQLTLGFEFGSEVSCLLDVGALCRLNREFAQTHRSNLTDALGSCHLGHINNWLAYEIYWATYDQPRTG